MVAVGSYVNLVGDLMDMRGSLIDLFIERCLQSVDRLRTIIPTIPIGLASSLTQIKAL